VPLSKNFKSDSMRPLQERRKSLLEDLGKIYRLVLFVWHGHVVSYARGLFPVMSPKLCAIGNIFVKYDAFL